MELAKHPGPGGKDDHSTGSGQDAHGAWARSSGSGGGGTRSAGEKDTWAVTISGPGVRSRRRAFNTEEERAAYIDNMITLLGDDLDIRISDPDGFGGGALPPSDDVVESAYRQDLERMVDGALNASFESSPFLGIPGSGDTQMVNFALKNLDFEGADLPDTAEEAFLQGALMASAGDAPPEVLETLLQFTTGELDSNEEEGDSTRLWNALTAAFRQPNSENRFLHGLGTGDLQNMEKLIEEAQQGLPTADPVEAYIIGALAVRSGTQDLERLNDHATEIMVAMNELREMEQRQAEWEAAVERSNEWRGDRRPSSNPQGDWKGPGDSEMSAEMDAAVRRASQTDAAGAAALRRDHPEYFKGWTIAKVEPESRRFWGWGYIFETADGDQIVDESGDTIDTPEARKAFENAVYKYVRDLGDGDDQHEEFGASRLIEAVVFTKEKAEMMGVAGAPGGVWLGYEALPTPAGDRLWERIKNGDRTMLSIVGKGQRL